MALPFDKTISRMLSLLSPTKSAGKTLMALNALGIAFAAASNTFAAATDKNTSPEDKKFLVPAGGATGVANVAIYLGMTNKLVDMLSSKGKYKDSGFSNKVLDKMIDNKTYETNALNFIDTKIAKMAKKAKTPKDLELLENMKTTLKNPDGSLTTDAKLLFRDNVSSGLGVAGAFIGAVVGCAIITPILRDVSGYFVQKAKEARDPSLKDKPYRPYFDISHIRSNGYLNGKTVYSKQPLSMKSYMTFTNGRTKI